MADTKEVLVIVPAHIGGRQAGAGLGAAFGGLANVTIVETAAEIPAALARANAIITALGPVSAEQLDAATALEVVQCASHGFDYVDIDAARRRGVLVANIGSSGAESRDVAEQTFALMLALAKQVVPAHNALVQGDWALPRLQHLLTELSEKTVGIVGFGNIGPEVAQRAAAFNMEVLYTARHRSAPDVEARYSATYVELDDLLQRADYVSLHLPLTDGTRNLLDRRRLALLKPTAFLINTSRGALVDQAALSEALHAGNLAGAGLDVFDPEPPPTDFPLLRAPNVVLSPHSAGVTRETLVRISMAAVRNVLGYLSGAALADVVS